MAPVWCTLLVWTLVISCMGRWISHKYKRNRMFKLQTRAREGSWGGGGGGAKVQLCLNLLQVVSWETTDCKKGERE